MKTTENDDQDCFHDHNPVMIIMMIMMVVTMEMANMINDSDYINQDTVRDNVYDPFMITFLFTLYDVKCK